MSIFVKIIYSMRFFLVSILIFMCSFISSAQSVGWLSLKSETDATAYIDGQFMSTVPATIALEAGTHELVVSKDMYYDMEQTVTIVPDSLVVVEVALTKKYSDVHVMIPTNVKASLDSSVITEADNPISLTYGEHVFTTSAIGCYDREYVVEVTEKTKYIILPEPVVIEGTLNVSSNANSATITINGQRYFKSFNEQLKVGDYFVSASAPGYETQERIVTVTENETTVVNFELEKVSSVKVKTNVENAHVFLNGEMLYENPFKVKLGQYTIQAVDDKGHSAQKKVDVSKAYSSYKLRIPYWSFPERDIIHIDLGVQIMPYIAFGFGVGFSLDNFINMDFHFTLGGKSNIGFIDSKGEFQWVTPIFSAEESLGYSINLHKHFRITPQVGFVGGGYKTPSSHFDFVDYYYGGEARIKTEYTFYNHIALHISPSYRFIYEYSGDPVMKKILGGFALKAGLTFYWGW